MEYGYTEAMCLRSLVSGVTFPKSVSPKQSLNKKAPIFVHGIRLRRSHVPQEPCGRGTISETGILEQNTGILCSRISLTGRADACDGKADIYGTLSGLP